MIDRLGLLLPGQGSQFVGMGQDLAGRFPAAREAFEAADEALGMRLSRLCWEGPEAELVDTRNAQPALLVHSVAVWRLIGGRVPDAALAAGHSLGEFTAYVLAGVLDFADAVRLVRRRGELMFEAGQHRAGSMAAVLGLDESAVDGVCSEISGLGAGVVVPANYNSPGQIVISGDAEAVRRAADAARAAGARRVMPLNVSGAFHSPLMGVAEAGLAERLEATDFRDPRMPVVSNVTAAPVERAGEARRLLLAQLTAPVRWTASLSRMVDHGVSRFLEIGAGHVLSNLVRRAQPGARTHAVGTADQVQAFLNHEVALWN